MRRILSRLGLSEIVGALMLVLIVVVAATAFSAFVATYQKQAQAEQAIQQDRNLEKLSVLNADPQLSRNGAQLNNFVFVLASLSVNPSVVTEIAINHFPLLQYNTTRLNLTTGTIQSGAVGAGGELFLGPRDQVTINVSLNASETSSYSLYSTYVLTTADAVQVDLFTGLENDFTRVYIPPTAIAIVTQLQTLSNGSYIPLPVLDGTNSFQPGTNESIVSWAWTLTPGNLTATGERVVEGGLAANTLYTITLRVTNSDGLVGSATITYHA
jgi:flagellin-like protein